MTRLESDHRATHLLIWGHEQRSFIGRPFQARRCTPVMKKLGKLEFEFVSRLSLTFELPFRVRVFEAPFFCVLRSVSFLRRQWHSPRTSSWGKKKEFGVKVLTKMCKLRSEDWRSQVARPLPDLRVKTEVRTHFETRFFHESGFLTAERT
jgi:hypothetical protein